MLNYNLNAGRGFHPSRRGSPDAITPEQVLRHHRSTYGRHSFVWMFFKIKAVMEVSLM